MEAVAEGLWGLAEYHEKTGQIGTAIKCLEAICQSSISFLPIIEAKTRLHVAILLLRHTHNLNQAKSHLERAQLLLNSIPSCFELKCRAFSLLSHCYHLLGSIPPQKQILYKALHLTSTAAPDVSVQLWSCNFNSQLANALVIEGDYQTSLTALESGFLSATQIAYPELQMFFTTSILHVHLMLWNDENSVDLAIRRCDEVWKTIQPDRRENCFGLFFYYELLNVFYRLSICDYKNASHHLDKLDAVVKVDAEKMREVRQLTNELNALNQSLSRSDLPSRERSALIARQAQLRERIGNIVTSSSAGKQSLESECIGTTRQLLEDKLVMAPAPMNGDWLPKTAAFALVDLMAVVFGRPKGNFKECEKRIHSGMLSIQEELVKLGITDGVGEVDLQYSVMRMASVYLTLLMQFLENKVAVELTRSEYVEAQEALVQMKSWFTRFPTILQACESSIEMLRGQYAHSVGCYSEAAFHYVEAAKRTESKSIQVMYRAYAAVSYFCIGDAESSSLGLDLIGPIKGMNDSSVGAREKASVLFAQGLLLMKQQDLQEARNRLAKGLQIAHNHMGNLQLVSQYLTILGNLALALHDTGQAREILRSSLTLAKKLFDIPTQIWVLSVLTVLYSELGEKGSEMENNEYRSKKLDDLQKRLGDARSSNYHAEIIEKATIEVQQYHNELDNKRAIAGQAMRVNLDIPESIGLSTPMPAQSSSRLVDIDTGRRGKRKR